MTSSPPLNRSGAFGPDRGTLPAPPRAHCRAPLRKLIPITLFWVLLGGAPLRASGPSECEWPAATHTMRPWAYWHWMGSAVDPANLSREISRYSDAGMGGMHVIPIYGARGYEERYLEYLGPRWLEMLRFAISEARRRGMGVDMTLGTGWNFGGPNIGDMEANANAVVQVRELAAGSGIREAFDPAKMQALMAFYADGSFEDLFGRMRPDGLLAWSPARPCSVYSVTQRPSGNPVDRAAPGGEGPMLNPFYARALEHYLERFTAAFPRGERLGLRAVYHDSYEYEGNWAPDLFAAFQKRRGYRLQEHLPSLFGKGTDERSARIRADYRETISDLMVERFMPLWVNWVHERGPLTRNQAHGSPGNLLDLYAAADIPETEMFRHDREVLVSKFASSAAHVGGRSLVAAETGTWLAEHFTVTLGDLKRLIDELFVSGVNHIFYHGTCYSPDDAPWPGWVFYASTQMNPRNSIWRDAPALNSYITRCQSILQGGKPDNEVLLYWPIHDLWHAPGNLLQGLSVHRREWLLGQPIGGSARRIWDRGYGFDYVSDRQLMSASVRDGKILLPGGEYRVLLVPPSRFMPDTTMARLAELAEAGALVAFEDRLPEDVPGWGALEERRARFRSLRARLAGNATSGARSGETAVGRGQVLVGLAEEMLARTGARRETMADRPGILHVRRATARGHDYFIANLGDNPLDGWIPLMRSGTAAVAMDPMSGRTGMAACRKTAGGGMEVYLQLEPGASMVVRVLRQGVAEGPRWEYARVEGEARELRGAWTIRFLQGGPEIPAGITTDRLASWTELGGEEARRFAGTALYTTTFRTEDGRTAYELDLGRVCQSARVRIDGRDLGTLFVSPFRTRLGAPGGGTHTLEVEVTNVAANRIRDLDRRGVRWKIFRNINFVNVDYKPFDASGWPLAESGLLGPVMLRPVAAMPDLEYPNAAPAGSRGKGAGGPGR